MDKKNTTIGVLLLIAAFASLYLSQKYAPPPPAQRAPELAPTAGPNQAAASAVTAAQPTSPTDATFAAVAAVTKDVGEPHYETLANDFIEVTFADLGGAISKVALKKYDAEKAHPGVPYVINQPRGNAPPALAFVDVPGLDSNTRYQVVSRSAVEVVYRTVLDQRIEVTRRYTLVPGRGDATHDPYQLRHETTFRNLTDSAQLLSPNQQVELSVGTATPMNERDYGLKLIAGYSTGSKQTFLPRSKLETSSGFFGLGAHEAVPQISQDGPIVWATVDNQFFSTIFTPDTPAAGFVMRRVKINLELPSTDRNGYGLTAETQFNLPALAPKAETKLAGDFYAGPKEYHRLSNAEIFKQDQDTVMQFGFFIFAFCAKILLTLMTWVHSLMPNLGGAWGFAIVITTLILKTVFLPLTLTASKSAKRMQKIQPEMQALKERYKDDPQKMQKETMELFKKHKVNPMGGCLPILITIPFFFGFFTMLQSAAELRFQPFLWAPDLSGPDTVAMIPLGFMILPLNIMPLLMGITSIIQMRLTPQPTTDNAQAKMLKFMPYMFILFCYYYSCALAVYWTVGNIFTIGQQLIINRMKDTVDTPVPAEPMRGGRPAKNVTPPKKKG
jgi:YidC/Oxa1 family membrane protein insertase